MGFVQVENRSCKMLHFVMSCMRQKNVNKLSRAECKYGLTIIFKPAVNYPANFDSSTVEPR